MIHVPCYTEGVTNTAFRLVPWGLRSRPVLTRDRALDTRTPRARRFVHPHSDTIPRYTQTLLPETSCENPRTLHSDTRAPLHSDTTSGYTRAPDSYTCPCAPRLHYFMVRALDSCSLKDEPTTNSWSGLRIRVFLLLLPLFFFFLSLYCSHPEVRILLLRISLDPFCYSSKPIEALKLTNFYSQITASFRFSTFKTPNSQLSTDRKLSRFQISTPKLHWCCWCWILVVVNDLNWEKWKW